MPSRVRSRGPDTDHPSLPQPLRGYYFVKNCVYFVKKSNMNNFKLYNFINQIWKSKIYQYELKKVIATK